MTPVLLRGVANGDQGPNTRTMLFPLNTGRWLFIVWWRATNPFVELHRSMVSLMRRSVASSFMLRSCVDSKKRNATHAGLSPSEQQALFLLPMEGNDSQLTRSALVCHQGCKQSEANNLIAYKGRAGPACGILLGHDLERCDAIYFQLLFPAAWGSVLCGLLSCSADRVRAGEERSWSIVGGCSRRHSTSVAEARGTTMGSTWTGNGKRLEAGPITTVALV